MSGKEMIDLIAALGSAASGAAALITAMRRQFTIGHQGYRPPAPPSDADRDADGGPDQPGPQSQAEGVRASPPSTAGNSRGPDAAIAIGVSNSDPDLRH